MRVGVEKMECCRFIVAIINAERLESRSGCGHVWAIGKARVKGGGLNDRAGMFCYTDRPGSPGNRHDPFARLSHVV